MSKRNYAFGDSDIAGTRLRLAADVFRPEMESFLTHAPTSPGLAYDLGCGPGFTTRILAGAVCPERTLGLDISSRFIEVARGRSTASVEYVKHDVTRAPFPFGPADLIFSHFLMPHLPDPASALAAWSTQLRPAGLVMLDEVSDIWTTQPTFLRYLDAVEQVVDAGGGQLYAGKVVERLLPNSGLAIISSQLVEHPVSTAQAATMFRLNLAAWGATPSARALFPAQSVAAIASELDRLAASPSRHEIVWGMRQVICKAAIAA